MKQGRIARICSLLPPARVYADVGCDHGYMAEYVLSHGLCERIFVTDIHEGSLKKAETLLAKYIENGRCMPVLCDGLTGVPERCDFVLIAGMGGEEIVKILQNAYMPPAFLFQPMKNAEKLRAFLLSRGARITLDTTFSEEKKGKFYDLLSGFGEGGDSYTDFELRYGRDNLKGNPVFLERMRLEREKLRARLAHAKGVSREALLEKYYETEMILDAAQTTV